MLMTAVEACECVLDTMEYLSAIPLIAQKVLDEHPKTDQKLSECLWAMHRLAHDVFEPELGAFVCPSESAKSGEHPVSSPPPAIPN